MRHGKSLQLDKVLLNLILVSRLLVGLVIPRGEREVLLVYFVLGKKSIVCLCLHQLIEVLLRGVRVFTGFDLLGLPTFNAIDHHFGAFAIQVAKVSDGLHSGQLGLAIFLLGGK